MLVSLGPSEPSIIERCLYYRGRVYMNVGLSIIERCLYYRDRVYMNVGLSRTN